MCGIAGLWGGQDDSLVTLPRLIAMSRAMRHRGPDDESFLLAGFAEGGWVRNYQAPLDMIEEATGHFDVPPDMLAEWQAASNGIAPQVGFAHRRLKIIDLRGGRQPLSGQAGALWICYNGEIYNYRELRAELEAAGFEFQTHSDTEVVVYAYAAWGEASFARLNGIFAYALLDRTRRRLYLVRDQLGVKPLYYARLAGGGLAFTSEYKAFLGLPGLDTALDYTALAEHFTFQNTYGDKTFLREVKLLPAGNFIAIERDGLRQEEYFDLRYQIEPDAPLDEREWAARLRETFEASVRRQLMSEVPLGTFLSGGMDTGSISAVAAHHIQPLHTFNCGFNTGGVTEAESLFDESAAAGLMAYSLGTSHHTLRIGPGDMEQVLRQVVWHLDEPRVGISYQVYYTAALVRQWVTVVLSGVGGDELFGGYPWRYRPISAEHDPVRFEELYYRLWHRMVPQGELAHFFTPASLAALAGFSTRDSFHEVLQKAPPEWHPLHRAMYFDAKTFLNGLLVVDDKLNMAHSVEGRVPFMDLEMLRLTAQMPAQLKLDAHRTKIVLREAMQGLIPDEVLNRPKVGFTPPDASWYRQVSRPLIEELVLGERALQRGIFRPDYLSRIWQEHLDGKANHRFLLWSLMCFEIWCRQFLEGEQPQVGQPLRIPAPVN